ncbi:hypothetical protein chiPu_0015086 [Chiloscyllium punctatum]|uniref:Uncharacterized protein n=1 Tax=Chiloscyllium punctatum TaxID=137246 RepID=A0A401T1S9_CHIPU|nr:hypothetical protein [Chiloscyllium punctatum]
MVLQPIKSNKETTCSLATIPPPPGSLEFQEGEDGVWGQTAECTNGTSGRRHKYPEGIQTKVRVSSSRVCNRRLDRQTGF